MDMTFTFKSQLCNIISFYHQQKRFQTSSAKLKLNIDQVKHPIFNNTRNIKKKIYIYKPFILFVTTVLEQIWNFNNGSESFIETPNLWKGFIAASTSQFAKVKYRINLNMSWMYLKSTQFNQRGMESFHDFILLNSGRETIVRSYQLVLVTPFIKKCKIR